MFNGVKVLIPKAANIEIIKYFQNDILKAC